MRQCCEQSRRRVQHVGGDDQIERADFKSLLLGRLADVEQSRLKKWKFAEPVLCRSKKQWRYVRKDVLGLFGRQFELRRAT